MVSDKTTHRLLEFIKLNKQNPLEKIFIFTIYQNYTLALRRGHAAALRIGAREWELVSQLGVIQYSEIILHIRS